MESSWQRHSRLSGNSRRSSGSAPPARKCRKLILYQLLSSTNLVIILLLFIVAVEFCYSKRLMQKSMEEAEGILERIYYPVSRHPEFRYKTEFQSHEPEVQEKKVKKISEMKTDLVKCNGNGSIASSSVSSSPNLYRSNGGCSDTSLSFSSNDLSFPPGGEFHHYIYLCSSINFPLLSRASTICDSMSTGKVLLAAISIFLCTIICNINFLKWLEAFMALHKEKLIRAD
ncbi:uncharacterized protein LOC141713742 isoform X2 [Apium graveolens]|uniref:uncharacterized protein LOC141713742 isoform X2 n=1 Tax=Apium graveolens TaxID=4045 RepID=UPI003D7A2E7F